jgi:hypothetical protein
VTQLDDQGKRPGYAPSAWAVECGAVVVHENGELYSANGRYCHRLNSDCEVIAETGLPCCVVRWAEENP